MRIKRKLLKSLAFVLLFSLSFIILVYAETTRISDTLINTTGNMTIGEKITFVNNEIIDNTIDGWITITGGLNTTQNIETENMTSRGYGFFDYISIGTTNIIDTLTISGTFDLIHTATEADDHAFEIEVDASGFGDVKGIDIFYDTGTMSLGSDEAIILINLDESEATGGDVFGIDILATEGSANVYGLKAGALVGPIHQDSGTFKDMDSVNNSGTDNLAEFISTASDVSIFTNDNDYVVIGDAAMFEELEFLLDTTASNPGIKPTFEFSTGTDTWSTFTPVDGTNGMRNTGIIAWEDDDIPTWATGTGSEYLIRINRTQNNLQTTPKEDKVQISAVTEYVWNEYGDVEIRNLNVSRINATDWTNVTITESQISDHTTYTNASFDIQNIPNENFVNISGDTMIGNLTIQNFTLYTNSTGDVIGCIYANDTNFILGTSC